MQKKLKLQKLMVVILAIIIAVIALTMLLGRENMVDVVVLTNEVDDNRYLHEQPENLGTVRMTEEDVEQFRGTLVINPQELQGMRLAYPLPVGAPIPTNALTEVRTGGQYAAETPIFHTTYRMPEMLYTLPPGVEAGDRIDINMIVEIPNTSPTEIVSGRLMEGVLIEDIQDETLFLRVSQSQFNELTLARRVGDFVLSLPGQKEVETCTVVERQLEDTFAERQEEIYSRYENYELSDAEMDRLVGEIEGEVSENQLNELREEYVTEKIAEELEQAERVHETMLENAECYTEEDQTQTISDSEIFDRVLRGEVSVEELFDNSEGEDYEDEISDMMSENEEQDEEEEDEE